MRYRSLLLAGWLGVGGVSSIQAQEPTLSSPEPRKLQLDAAPMPVGSANQHMADAIAAALGRNPQLRRYRIDIVYTAGVAELHGQVSDLTQRELARQTVLSVPGVHQIRDRLVQVGLTEPEQTQEPVPLLDKKPAEIGVPPILDGGGAGGGIGGGKIGGKGPGKAGGGAGGPAFLDPPAKEPMLKGGAGGVGGPSFEVPPSVPFTPPIPNAVPGTVPNLSPTPGGMPQEPTPIYQPEAGALPNPKYQPPPLPPYAWPTYAPYNNYSRVGYPTLHNYNQWPFIGPMYPYPKIPLGWRRVTLEWQDGSWWYGRESNSHDWWRVRYW